MAIYKPSNCIPFSNAIDLTEKQDITCELNTSNTDVTGYKTRVLDSNNNVIFAGNDFTNLNDKTLVDYYNTGLNGSELTLPIVITDPGSSNINNIYFGGYNWHHWRPHFENITSGNAYFKGPHYFRVSSQTTANIYPSISVYEKIGNVFRLVSKPSTVLEAENAGYYYAAGSNSNSYYAILTTGSSVLNNSYLLTKEDYDSIDEVYSSNTGSFFAPTKANALEDNVYYQPYVMVTRKNISEKEYDDITALYSVTENAGSGIQRQNYTYGNAILNELYYHESYSPFSYIPDRKISYGKYYYLNQDGDMEMCYFGDDTSYSNISVIYDKIGNFNPIGPNEKPSYSSVGSYDWDNSKYYIKKYYSTILNNIPETYDDALVDGYYYLDTDGSIKLIGEGSITNDTGYQNYLSKGTLYQYIGIITYDSNVNSVSYYIKEQRCTNNEMRSMSQEDYENTTLFEDRYILVSNVDEEFYENNIYYVYDIAFNYNVIWPIDEEAKPLYGESILNHYYFRSKEYIPVTEEASHFSSYSDYYLHDNGNYYVIDPECNEYGDAYDNGYYYLNYERLSASDCPEWVTTAIEDDLYYIEDNPTDTKNPYKKITSLINQAKYYSYVHSDPSKIYKLNGLVEAPSTNPGLGYTPYFYKPVLNFYNGYKYQPYKWQITLKQGDIGTQTLAYRDQKWYDMTITSGLVLGSTTNRIQGILSDEIYRDYYIQLCSRTYDVDNPGNISDVYKGPRTRIKTYDHSFGYLYPQEGEIEQANLDAASYFQVYKYTNDPEYVSASRKVTYATTVDIDEVQYNGATPVGNFSHENDRSAYYTQVYGGNISANNITIDKYDTRAVTQIIAPLSTSILIKNQLNAELNGVYWFASVSYDEDNDKTTIRWQRTANADSYADFIETAFYIENGSYSTQNFVCDAQAGNGALNTTRLTFYPEKPIKIYPEFDGSKYGKYYNVIEDVYAYTKILNRSSISTQQEAIDADYYYKSGDDYYSIANYTGTFDTTEPDLYKKEDMRSYFSPVLKNSNTRTFIRPFVGILDGMRFQYGENLNNYVSINYVDNFDANRGGLWYIDHAELPYGPILTPDVTDYTISSYFKESDENPFYAYKRPYVDINILNATSEVDYFGNHVIGNRYALVDAVYKQEQNKTWKYFQWDLYNSTTDLEVQNTDPTYSGSFRHRFVGIEAENDYKISILFEDELGFVTQKIEAFSVDIKIESGRLFNIHNTLNCDLQTIDFSFVRNGIINPVPYPSGEDTKIEYNEEKQFMKIDNYELDRKYGVLYDQIDIDGAGNIVNIPIPTENRFTLNSQHILGQYFQGDILALNIEKDGVTYTLTINSSTDTIKSGEEIVQNPNRSNMSCTLSWGTSSSSSNSSYLVRFIDGTINPEAEGAELPTNFREIQPPVFSLGKNATVPNESCDYLYTTQAYSNTGTPISGFYNLANKDYNEHLPNDNPCNSTKYLYRYNCDNSSFNSSTILYSPLTTNPSPNTTIGSTTFGVWYDEIMVSNEQADGTNVLITNRASSAWPSSDAESSLYWHDSDDAYNFYEQYDLNRVDEEDGKNHSGRQDFEKMRLTFNIGANNYDQTEGTGQFDFNQNTVHCFIETL